jgi:hypothetical protein
VEPHVVGEDGHAYLRLYEMTGNTKYPRAAICCAEALAGNFKPGDEPNRYSSTLLRIEGANREPNTVVQKLPTGRQRVKNLTP